MVKLINWIGTVYPYQSLDELDGSEDLGEMFVDDPDDESDDENEESDVESGDYLLFINL